MKIGYSRISTADQSLDLQKDKLKAFGCERLFDDVISGSKFKREGLNEMFKVLRKGDVLVVWRLDRLGRNLKELITIVADLEEKGIGFYSMTENINTTTPSGKLIFNIFGSLAEFERNLIIERTRAGLESARARGRLGGRTSIHSKENIRMAHNLHNDKNNKISDILKIMNISKASLYNLLKRKVV